MTPDRIDGDLDWARFPFEARRAVEAAGHPCEWLPPGRLSARPAGDGIEVLSDGQPLAIVERYRLEALDDDLVRSAAHQLAEALPVGQHDQIKAAVRRGGIGLAESAASDWVELSADGQPFGAVHRRHVVRGWPQDDVDA